jgi:hypothetical protein
MVAKAVFVNPHVVRFIEHFTWQRGHACVSSAASADGLSPQTEP